MYWSKVGPQLIYTFVLIVSKKNTSHLARQNQSAPSPNALGWQQARVGSPLTFRWQQFSTDRFNFPLERLRLTSRSFDLVILGTFHSDSKRQNVHHYACYFLFFSKSYFWIGISRMQAYKKVGNLVPSWLVPSPRFSGSPKWVAAPPSWAQTMKSPSQLDFPTSAAGGWQFVFSQSSSCQTKRETAGWISERKGGGAVLKPGDSVQWLSADNCLRRIRWSRSQSTGVNLKGPPSFLFHPGLKWINFAENPPWKNTIDLQKTEY